MIDVKAALALLLCVSSATAVNLVVFGDSWSDTGNLFAQMTECGFETPLPDPELGYFDGRFSDGPVFTEDICDQLGLECVIKAVSGAHATTDVDFDDPVPPCAPISGLISQISNFERDIEKGVVCPEESVALIFLGGNDISDALFSFVPSSFSLKGIISAVKLQRTFKEVIAQAIDQLERAGIKHILLASLYPIQRLSGVLQLADQLEEVPIAGQKLSEISTEGLEKKATGFNNDLQAIAQEKSTDTTSVTYLDFFNIFSSVIDTLEEQGLEAKENCLGVTFFDDEGFEGIPCEDPGQFIFYDNIHPTRASHALFAELVVAKYKDTLDSIIADLEAVDCKTR